MMFQSIGSMVIGLECISRLRPDVLIDTMGCPFIYPVFKILGLHPSIIAYVHYPIISAVTPIL